MATLNDVPPRVLCPDDVKYPDKIVACLGNKTLPSLGLKGDSTLWSVLSDNLLALVCSAKAPAGIILTVHEWYTGSRVIISGFYSPVEQEAFEILLRGSRQVVYCPARSLPKRIKPAWRSALDAGRQTGQKINY